MLSSLKSRRKKLKNIDLHFLIFLTAAKLKVMTKAQSFKITSTKTIKMFKLISRLIHSHNKSITIQTVCSKKHPGICIRLN